MMNVKTMDGVVHTTTHEATMGCPLAWETVTVEERIWGTVSVVVTDEPVTCLDCIANEPQSNRAKRA